MTDKITKNVVAAIIIKDNLIFCAKRGGVGECANKWEFPGGKIEKGETDEQTIKREIKEELDCEIEVTKYLTTIHYEYHTFILNMKVYLSKIIKGTPKKIVHLEQRFVSLDELKTLDFLPADKAILDMLDEEVIHK